VPGDRTKKQLTKTSSAPPRVNAPQEQPAPGSVSSAVLWFQQRAGNAATNAMIQQRAPLQLPSEQKERISQARQFWLKLTETKPPDHGDPSQALRQAPPGILDVLPEGPGLDGSSEPADEAPSGVYISDLPATTTRSDHQPDAQDGTEEIPEAPTGVYVSDIGGRSSKESGGSELEGSEEEKAEQGGYLSEQEARSQLPGSQVEEESEGEEPSGVYLESVDSPGDAQVGRSRSGSESSSAPSVPAVVGSARAQRNWAKLRAAVTKVSGSPGKVLPERQGPLKLLNFESPFQPGTTNQLKPRRNVTMGSSGFTTWSNYWLEALDGDHRPGFILAKRWEEWFQSGSQENFWNWLGDKGADPNDPLEAPYFGKEVRYLDEEEQQNQQGQAPGQQTDSEKRELMLLSKEGKLYQDGDEFDTSNMSTVASGGGWAIYVVSTGGVWYANSHKEAKFHHSSFLAGGAVRAAGELKVEDGRLIQITGKSGHYRPTTEHLLWAVRQLRARGVDLSGATVGDYERSPDGSLRTGLDGKPVTKWFPAEQFAEAGPMVQSGPLQAPDPGGAQAPVPLQGGQGGQVSNLQPKPPSTVSAEERAELLAKARTKGWVEKDGFWENDSNGEAYVSEEELVARMTSS